MCAGTCRRRNGERPARLPMLRSGAEKSTRAALGLPGLLANSSPQRADPKPAEFMEVPLRRRGILVSIRETAKDMAIDRAQFAKPLDVREGFSKDPGRD